MSILVLDSSRQTDKNQDSRGLQNNFCPVSIELLFYYKLERTPLSDFFNSCNAFLSHVVK